MLHIVLALAAANAPVVPAQARWEMQNDGGISWTVKTGGKPHEDHLEMSGRKVSVIVYYGVREGKPFLHRAVIWPSLRTIPNDTHASQRHDWGVEVLPAIEIDGKPLDAAATGFRLRGMLTIESKSAEGIELTRTIFPSTTKPAVIENCTLRNMTGKPVAANIGPIPGSETSHDSHRSHISHRTDPAKGVDGAYTLTATSDLTSVKLEPGESVDFSIIFAGRKEKEPELVFDPKAEEKARRDYVDSLWSKLKFECPDPVLEREFAFAKLRAAESIFETKGGLMHGPGGGAYYAAIWANDQAEYANPFFPFLGDPTGNASALNSYRLFARHMNPEYKPVPSSIIAEGTDTWSGAGDRGDAAMIAYGASRYAMVTGDMATAREMWPLIEWCLEYCKRKTNSAGVVASDHDELEGRFPAGDANLCTSSLYYDALRSAAHLARELGKDGSRDSHASRSAEYTARAEALHRAIEKHFGATIGGHKTYRYYDGNTTLRAWICIPLAMGIFDRKDETIKALFSPELWTDDGLATEAGNKTFWDRSTLYALRGVFAAGETERALKYLQYYSHRRLLEEHVPYPVEAWPEGGQRHLSAESALYCRVITEGLFGIRPTGLRSFELTPRLPENWDKMALRRVQAFGNVFDIEVHRNGGKLVVDVVAGGRNAMHQAVEPGATLLVKLL